MIRGRMDMAQQLRFDLYFSPLFYLPFPHNRFGVRSPTVSLAAEQFIFRGQRLYLRTPAQAVLAFLCGPGPKGKWILVVTTILRFVIRGGILTLALAAIAAGAQALSGPAIGIFRRPAPRAAGRRSPPHDPVPPE